MADAAGDEQAAESVEGQHLARLAGEVDQLLAAGTRMPLTNTVVVREADVVALLARMRADTPPEASAVWRAREQCADIRQRAQRETSAIVTEANEEVARLVHDTHLLRDTRERVDEIVREARTKADMVRAGADAFVAATLHTFSQQLDDLSIVLRRDLTAIEDGLGALRERLAAAARDRDLPDEHSGVPLPLTPNQELLPPDPSIRHEYRLPPDQTAPVPEPRGGPNSPAPNSPLS